MRLLNGGGEHARTEFWPGPTDKAREFACFGTTRQRKRRRGRQREGSRRLASESSRQQGGASTLESDKLCTRGPNSWRTTSRQGCPLAPVRGSLTGDRSR